MHPKSTSQVGIDLIKKFEGLHRVGKDGLVRAYRDPVGIWTIGYGSIKGVRSGMTITKEQADDLLVEDVARHEQYVKQYVKVPLTQNQFDALSSFVFNVGPGNFRKSTLLKRLNRGAYDEVPGQLQRWNKARVKGNLTVLNGLVRRRAAEAALFTMDTPLGEGMVQKVSADDAPQAHRKTKQAAAGIAGISTALTAGSEQLQNFVGFHEYITYAFVGLTILGIATFVIAEIVDGRNETL